MPDKLGLYNQALLSLGEPKLRALDDNVESRRVLDTVWDNRAIQAVLERAYWKFSLRSVALLNDENFTPAFGHPFTFLIPEDYLRTYMLCTDDLYRTPVVDYQLEGGKIYASRDTVFLRYVSKTNGEIRMDTWPSQFEQTVALYLAQRAAPKLVNGRKAEKAEKDYEKQLMIAMNMDVIENPPAIRQQSSWSRARGRHHGRYGRE